MSKGSPTAKAQDRNGRLVQFDLVGSMRRSSSDKHQFTYGSYRTALTQNVPQVALEMGNSVHMVKRHYLEAKTFDEGLCWFRIAWPLPKKERANSPFLRWVAAAT